MSNILEFTLPISGKSATIRPPTGRDTVEAERLAGKDAGALSLQIALLSRVCTIGGRVLPFEDFLDMDFEDINALGKLDPRPKEPSPAPPSGS